jgi:hypothetical protein
MTDLYSDSIEVDPWRVAHCDISDAELARLALAAVIEGSYRGYVERLERHLEFGIGRAVEIARRSQR